MTTKCTVRILNKTNLKLVPCDLELERGSRSEREGERGFSAIQPGAFQFAFKCVASTIIPSGVKGFSTYEVGQASGDLIRIDFNVPAMGKSAFSCRSLNGRYKVSVPGTITGREVEVPVTVEPAPHLPLLVHPRAAGISR
ncbi:hypothetical protein PAPYR_9554 [Paratrimastix pyriformis]|uniref:Uncharacterized protein n=1 Tax=Paratrimastix pyriformis TaxID=342808 RepID=A0ABQ8U824_9EUKA|nr:hypothetical protein PAPYR_9554 [Paratrimastix pyriformis]